VLAWGQGSSQVVKRSWTCGTTTTAMAAAAAKRPPPSTTYAIRAVAMYMSATKIDMKSSAMPKSFMKMSMASDSTHMTSSGPKYLAAGSGTPRTWCVGTESSAFLSFR